VKDRHSPATEGLIKATAGYWREHGGTFKQFCEAWNLIALNVERREREAGENLAAVYKRALNEIVDIAAEAERRPTAGYDCKALACHVTRFANNAFIEAYELEKQSSDDCEGKKS